MRTKFLLLVDVLMLASFVCECFLALLSATSMLLSIRTNQLQTKLSELNSKCLTVFLSRSLKVQCLTSDEQVLIGFLFFTARVRSTREGNIYTWECLSVHNCGGGGYPVLGLGEGGTPSQVWWQGGYPIPGLVGGYPLPPDLRWGTPLDLGWGTPKTWDGVPPQDLEWGTPQTWDLVPPLDLGLGTPPRPGTGYPPEHLIRGGRYASCVHAGGLSCCIVKTICMQYQSALWHYGKCLTKDMEVVGSSLTESFFFCFLKNLKFKYFQMLKFCLSIYLDMKHCRE